MGVVEWSRVSQTFVTLGVAEILVVFHFAAYTQSKCKKEAIYKTMYTSALVSLKRFFTLAGPKRCLQPRGYRSNHLLRPNRKFALRRCLDVSFRRHAGISLHSLD